MKTENPLNLPQVALTELSRTLNGFCPDCHVLPKGNVKVWSVVDKSEHEIPQCPKCGEFFAGNRVVEAVS